MASSPRDLVSPVVLRLQVCTATIHGFVYMNAENSLLLLPSPSPDRFYLCSPGCSGLALYTRLASNSEIHLTLPPEMPPQMDIGHYLAQVLFFKQQVFLITELFSPAP